MGLGCNMLLLVALASCVDDCNRCVAPPLFHVFLKSYPLFQDCLYVRLPPPSCIPIPSAYQGVGVKVSKVSAALVIFGIRCIHSAWESKYFLLLLP